MITVCETGPEAAKRPETREAVWDIYIIDIDI